LNKNKTKKNPKKYGTVKKPDKRIETSVKTVTNTNTNK
jgi:hypothetical protein